MRGNRRKYGQEEDGEQEQDSRRECRKPRLTARGNACACFNKGGYGRSTQQCAACRCDRVGKHNSIIVHRNAVFSHKTCSGTAAYAGTHGIEHIYHTEGDNNHNERHNGYACFKFEPFGKCRKEGAAFSAIHREEAFEILPECPAFARPFRNAKCRNYTKQGCGYNTDNNRTLYVKVRKHCNNKEAKQAHQWTSNHRHIPRREFHHGDYRALANSNDTCVCKTDNGNKQTDTNRNCTSNRLRDCLIDNFSDRNPVHFNNGQEKEQNARQQNEEHCITKRQSKADKATTQQTADHGV